MSAERILYNQFCQMLSPQIAKAGLTDSIIRLYHPKVLLEYCIKPETYKIHQATIHVVTSATLTATSDTPIKKKEDMSVFMSVYYKLENLEGGEQKMSMDHLHSYVGYDNPILDILSVQISHTLPKILEQIPLRYSRHASAGFLQLIDEQRDLGYMQELLGIQYHINPIEEQNLVSSLLCIGETGCAESCELVHGE